MRKRLQQARKDKGLTQQQMAKYLNISVRAYQSIEYAERIGSIAIWDKLEDLFKIHQRLLREVSERPNR